MHQRPDSHSRHNTGINNKYLCVRAQTAAGQFCAAAAGAQTGSLMERGMWGEIHFWDDTLPQPHSTNPVRGESCGSEDGGVGSVCVCVWGGGGGGGCMLAACARGGREADSGMGWKDAEVPRVMSLWKSINSAACTTKHYTACLQVHAPTLTPPHTHTHTHSTAKEEVKTLQLYCVVVRSNIDWFKVYFFSFKLIQRNILSLKYWFKPISVSMSNRKQHLIAAWRIFCVRIINAAHVPRLWVECEAGDYWISQHVLWWPYSSISND